MLLIASANDTVNIYFKSGEKFNGGDAIRGFNSRITVVDVTFDGKWLLVIEANGISRIFKFNFSKNKF